jgi:hypothetical protein
VGAQELVQKELPFVQVRQAELQGLEAEGERELPGREDGDWVPLLHSHLPDYLERHEFAVAPHRLLVWKLQSADGGGEPHPLLVFGWRTAD